MLRGVINEVPTWLLIPTVVVLTIGIVLLAVWLVRRLLPAVGEGFDAEVASQMLGVVAALFGLLLAFIIVIGYQNFVSADENVSREADDLATIVRDSGAFSQPEGDRVRRAVGAYVRLVVDEEWSRMRDGHDSPQAWAAVDDLYAAVQDVQPGSPREVAFHENTVERLNEALAARRDRLDTAEGGLPGLVAALLIAGSIVILGYSVLVGSSSFGFHALGAGAIALILALSLVVLLDLSYPFSGDLAIEPSPFKTGALAQFFDSG